jgi:DNA-binding winged helix-turn-helix (wHTH) protein/TolB-like protein/Tfp pilus assembly protein PilF
MADRPSSPGRAYIFGPFRFDVARQQLYRDGGRVELTRRLERALQLLLENHGKDLGKGYLMEQLWPNTVVEENNLSVIISMLRKALGDDVEQKKFIMTNPGLGYRFVAQVIETERAEVPDQSVLEAAKAVLDVPLPLSPATPDLVQDTRFVPAVGAPAVRSTWWRWAPMGAAVIFLLLVLGAYVWSRANSTATMAVLPFQSLGAPSDSELGLGMADALIARLATIHGIAVRPTGEILKYQNGAYDLIAVGKELRVVSLVDGTVQRIGDQIWLRVKLLRVKDGAILWAGEYHGRFADVLTLQDQIAEQATQALTQRFNSAKPTAIYGHFSGNSEAHQAYLAGRDSCIRVGNKRSLERGVSYFQRAIARDTDFALAYAGLAACLIQLADAAEPAQRAQFLADAKGAAESALKIDPSLPEAHLSLAQARTYYEWNYPEAEAAFRRSIDLAPEIVSGHVEYSAFLLSQGHFPQAEREARRAAELDPLSWDADIAISNVYFYERRYGEAAERWEKARELAPHIAPVYLAWIYASQGRLTPTDSAVSTQAENPGNPRRAFYTTELAYLYALRGLKAEARGLLGKLEQYPDRNNVDEYDTGLVYVALGDPDRALEMLHRAKQNRSNEVILLNVDPRVDSLRSDPRFQDLLRSLHLKS